MDPSALSTYLVAFPPSRGTSTESPREKEPRAKRERTRRVVGSVEEVEREEEEEEEEEEGAAATGLCMPKGTFCFRGAITLRHLPSSIGVEDLLGEHLERRD